MYTPLCSLLVDDDFFDCKCSPSSPKRCDRGQSFCVVSSGAARSNLPRHHSAIRSGSNSMHTPENLFSCCTEELGSESTSGVWQASTATMNYCNPSIFYDDHTVSMPAEAPRSWASMHQPNAFALSATKSEEGCPSLISRSPHQSFTPVCQYDHECHRRRSTSCGNVQTFPPPLSSLLCDRPFMRSFKSNGRFILKKIDNVSRSLFRSTRKDGRLRLDLLSGPSDGFPDQYSPLWPANRPVLSRMTAPTADRFQCPACIPPIPSFKWNFNSTFVRHKPSLSCKALSPQALAMLMHSKSPGTSFVEKPVAPISPSSSGHISEYPTDVKAAASHALPRMPHVFALVNLFPDGLGLIILKFGQSKHGNFVALHGVYILKSLGFQCIGDSIVDPFFTNHLCGVGAKVPEGKLFPSEHCCKN